MKDYYRILGVPTVASNGDIKKAYRTLALKYHPDRNAGAYAHDRFLEINEAYEVLSDPARRKRYDEDRFYSGMGSKEPVVEVTAAWLAGIALQLNQSLSKMDLHRISHGALQQYLLLVLSPAHIAILHLENNPEQNVTVVTEVLRACRHLEARYLPEIKKRLYAISNEEPVTLLINHYFEQRERDEFLKKMYPYFVLLATLAMCALMYYYTNAQLGNTPTH